MTVNHDSTTSIRIALQEMGLSLKKRWGQNFLVNRGAREKIISLLGVRPGDLVWEIGPGLGAMTEMLLSAGARVTAFEVDRGLCRHLSESLGGRPGFSLVPGDFLRTWEAAEAEARPARILGNLPYRSASLMIAALVPAGIGAEVMVFTVQRELAQRITAEAGDADYSSFTVLCRAAFSAANKGDLKPGSFYPAPNVASTIVELRPRRDAGVGDWDAFSRLCRALFATRRKTIRNNLQVEAALPSVPVEARMRALEGAGIDPGARAQELAPDAFVKLASIVFGWPPAP